MIVDLHAHYAMHLVPEVQRGTLRGLLTRRGRARLRDRVRALLIGLASRFRNYRSFHSGPRVTVPLMHQGEVAAILSVLYSFFDEFDLRVPYGSDPLDAYLEALEGQLDLVEEEIASDHAGDATVARSPAELDAALAAGRVALVHCVEGGFHLGATPEGVASAVERLARRGVAYVIPAHLVYRGVATNAPAIPPLTDRWYHLLFPQPDLGLSELGAAMLEAMVREGVLIDLSHMGDRAIADSFALLDRVDPGREVPVIASHSAFRFGKQEYGLSEATVERIAERDGVVGLIFARHQMLSGRGQNHARDFEGSFELLCAHIDRIAEITGSRRHVAVGSDFDGFIKPTLGGLETMADMLPLHAALRERYDDDGDLIAHDNALRVLRKGWRGAD